MYVSFLQVLKLQPTNEVVFFLIEMYDRKQN